MLLLLLLRLLWQLCVLLILALIPPPINHQMKPPFRQGRLFCVYIMSGMLAKSPLARGAEARGGVGEHSIHYVYEMMCITACRDNGATHPSTELRMTFPVTQKKRDTLPRRGLAICRF